ncbi:MAG: hypothetical protein QGG36_06620 [Pirellulaceae bacterium]|jgi:hypothetical protein|nr:hypothetical protein [Pirellulaceae bacterium]
MSNDSHELISAYFDDELSSDERVRAEELLRESEELREFLEELQGVRNELTALPQESLDANFASRVLAEVGELKPAAPEPDAPAEQAGPASAETARDKSQQWFVVAAIIATAAAITLVVSFFRDPGDNPHVVTPEADPDNSVVEVPVPPDPGPDVVEPPDPGPEIGVTQMVEFAGVPVRAVVVAEFHLTERGVRDRVFDDVLERFEIPMRDTREVDGPAKTAIEKSQMFRGKTGDATGSVRMAVVLASIKQHTEIIESLEMQDGSVAGTRFNISLHSSDFDVFREFNRVNQAVTQARPDAEQIHVFQFELGEALESIILQREALVSKLAGQLNTTKNFFRGEKQVPLIYLVRGPAGPGE